MSESNNIIVKQSSQDFLHQDLANLGYRVFSTLRTHIIPASSNHARKNEWKYEPATLHLDKHVNRINKSNEELKIGQFDSEAVTTKILTTLRNAFYRDNRPEQEASIKIVLSKKECSILIDKYNAIFKDEDIIDAVIFKGERHLPQHKTTSAAISVYARKFAEDNHAQEAIFVDKLGIVREGAWSNLFWFNKSGKLFTTASQVLPGVTRDIIQSIEDTNLLDVSYEDFINSIDEAFITQSTAGIIPLKSIDGKALGSGNEDSRTIQLKAKFQEYLARNSKTVFE